MPNPIATALTIYNSAKYIKNGLKALSECKLNVDVLDSASIVACFARKNFKRCWDTYYWTTGWDEIRIHTGNVIPIDGIVTDGEATVNEASITVNLYR